MASHALDSQSEDQAGPVEQINQVFESATALLEGFRQRLLSLAGTLPKDELDAVLKFIEDHLKFCRSGVDFVLSGQNIEDIDPAILSPAILKYVSTREFPNYIPRQLLLKLVRYGKQLAGLETNSELTGHTGVSQSRLHAILKKEAFSRVGYHAARKSSAKKILEWLSALASSKS